ncbi:nucleotidyltransferase domain-containing protein [Candidatus Bathyarchaeota archaeon]|nr:nucleotidyltransferase domain-containing protein [Candidatus Bathyarchaeota archaeon]
MSTREQVAREAARLLYNRTVKEYKDAKEMAASSLGTRALPSNFEVAEELDKITEEREGSDRLSGLMEMRQIALRVMNALKDNDPTLIGSVWRGTPRMGSDIDIVVYSENWREVEKKLGEYLLVSAKPVEFTVNGVPLGAVHIGLNIDEHPVEVVVRPPEDRDAYDDERCETYGDIKKGLKLQELERLMRTDPLRRFIPKRRVR